MPPGADRPLVLLLNPPAAANVARDHYHSQILKGAYVWHPNDLLIQSGWLQRHFRVRLLDAVAGRLSHAQAMRRVLDARPDHVLSLVGEATAVEDRRFLARLRERLPQATLVAAGDSLQFREDDPFADHPELDGVLTYIAAPDLDAFFRERRSAHVRVPGGPAPAAPASGTFRYPPPVLEQFVSPRYRLPFYGGRPFHSITTSLGCPWRCRFCVVPRFARQLRDLADVREELAQVRAAGVRDLYVRDASFGWNPPHAQAFCDEVRRAGGLRWNTFTRADFLDAPTVSLLRRSGCFMVHLGVETWNDEALAREDKRLTLERMEEAFRRCREGGLRTSAHFVLGLGGYDPAEEAGIARTLRRLRPDMVAFSVLCGRAGLSAADRARGETATADPRLSALQRRLTRRFYLRPQAMLEQATQVRSARALRALAADALVVLRKPPGARGAAAREPAVSLVRCERYEAADVERALAEVLAPFGGPAALAFPGARVLLKPNLLRAAGADAAVTTHPEVLRACIRAVRAAGGLPLVGDQPAVQEGAGALAAARRSGLAQVCAEEGVEWANPGRDGYEPVELAPGLAVLVSRLALRADAVVSVGKVKTHLFTGATGALKNLFGLVAPAERRRLHRELSPRRFARALAGLAAAFPLRFSLLDGVVGMEGAGPGQGTPRHLGLLLGSPDVVALDRLAAHVTGMDRRPLPILEEAGRARLGEADLERVLVLGEDPARVRVEFRLPPPLPATAGDVLTRLHFGTFSVVARVAEERCSACGACVKACPTAAMAGTGVPQVDPTLCVSCFCCHEVCPSGAVQESYGALAKPWRWLRERGDKGPRDA